MKISGMRDFFFSLNLGHNLVVQPPSEKASSVYRAYVGKGNNHILVRMILKQRWWWSIVDS
jgi:tubulin--tyrosine ligase